MKEVDLSLFKFNSKKRQSLFSFLEYNKVWKQKVKVTCRAHMQLLYCISVSFQTVINNNTDTEKHVYLNSITL